MSSVNPEFVERYQLEYQRNPQSRIFAPLSEAYRKMGLIEEAFQICSKGVAFHPEFAGGRVAFAKVLIDRKQLEEARLQLEQAVQLSPDNLLAHSLMGDVLLEMRQPKEALKAYKMVLFLNPADEKALRSVKKWEFLTAEEFESDVFEMKPLFRETDSKPQTDRSSEEASPREISPKDLDRTLSLADAFTVRNDIERARDLLLEAQRRLGRHPDILNRLALLSRRTATLPDEEPETIRPMGANPQNAATHSLPTGKLKKERLERFLQRINERRSTS